MKFTSTRYPSLQLGSGPTTVRFVDGAAEVSDADRITALKALPEAMGVRAVEEPKPKKTKSE